MTIHYTRDAMILDFASRPTEEWMQAIREYPRAALFKLSLDMDYDETDLDEKKLAALTAQLNTKLADFILEQNDGAKRMVFSGSVQSLEYRVRVTLLCFVVMYEILRGQGNQFNSKPAQVVSASSLASSIFSAFKSTVGAYSRDEVMEACTVLIGYLLHSPSIHSLKTYLHSDERFTPIIKSGVLLGNTISGSTLANLGGFLGTAALKTSVYTLRTLNLLAMACDTLGGRMLVYRQEWVNGRQAIGDKASGPSPVWR